MERFVEQYTNFCRELATLLPKDVAAIQAVRETLKEDAGGREVLSQFLGWVRPRLVALSQKDVAGFWGGEQAVMPGVDIAGRWEKFSESTQESLWRWGQVLYLSAQAAAMTAGGGGGGEGAEGEIPDIAAAFEGMDPEEMEAKTQEIMAELMKNLGSGGSGGGGGGGGGEGINAPDFNPEEFEKMGKDLLKGTTLGEVADEMIQEILSGQFKFGDVIAAMEAELKDETDPARVVAKLMSSKHKGKLMQLMRKLASRLQEKLKSKNVSQDVLMREAAAVMERLQNTEVLDKIRSMAGGLGGAMGGGGGRAGKRVNKKKARKMRKRK